MRGRHSIALILVLLPWLAAAHVDAAEDPIYRQLTTGHPEVAALLKEHPRILEILHEPMWEEVVLNAPQIPDTPWRVHDLRRPQPPLVTPGARACAATASPPSDAVVIFDGRDMNGFTADPRALWTLSNGELVGSGTQSNRLATRAAFGDVQIHLEFATPRPPEGIWQYRGNSGIFLMGRYEVQILDSFDNPTYADGQAAALYGQVPPLANASRPPGTWQCFDVAFSAPRFDANGGLRAPARITLFHNSVLVQNDAVFLGPTEFAKLAPYQAHAAELPFTLQDHGDRGSRVRFRNIWARRLAAPAAEIR